MNRAAMTITAAALLACGCAQSRPPAARPAESARTSYWLEQPEATRIAAADFDRLWRACEESAREFGFRVDRQNYRGGVLTTEPLTSKQFFEFWRRDVATPGDLANSSLATYRRTLRFDIKRTDDGFEALPRVVIERQARAEQPITSSVYLRHAFRRQRRVTPQGTPETDRGVFLPRQYWYATGRDETLERNVARAVAKRLART